MFARMLEAWTPSAVVPPTMIAFGPRTNGAPPALPAAGRSLTSTCYHSGRSPVDVGTAQ